MKEENRAEQKRSEMEQSLIDSIRIEAYAPVPSALKREIVQEPVSGETVYTDLVKRMEPGVEPSGLKSLRRRVPVAEPELPKRKFWTRALSFFLLPVHLVVFTAIGIMSGAAAWHSDTFGEDS